MKLGAPAERSRNSRSREGARPASYVSTVAAYGGQSLPAPFIADAAPPHLILPDIPLMRDVDDAAAASTRTYVAGEGFGEGGGKRKNAPSFASAEATRGHAAHPRTVSWRRGACLLQEQYLPEWVK